MGQARLKLGALLLGAALDMWEEFLGNLDTAVNQLGEPTEVMPGCTGGSATSFITEGAGASDVTLDLETCGLENMEIGQGVLQLVAPFSDLVNLKAHTQAGA